MDEVPALIHLISAAPSKAEQWRLRLAAEIGSLRAGHTYFLHVGAPIFNRALRECTIGKIDVVRRRPGEYYLVTLQISLTNTVFSDWAVPVSEPDCFRLRLRHVLSFIVEVQRASTIFNELQLVHILQFVANRCLKCLLDGEMLVHEYRRLVAHVEKGQHVFAQDSVHTEVERVVLLAQILIARV